MLTEFEKLVLEMQRARSNGFIRCLWESKEALNKYTELRKQVETWLAKKQAQEQDPTPDLFDSGKAGE